MFNFFNELRESVKTPINNHYNMVNISGELLYIEGHLGIRELSSERIIFKVKNGSVVVEGKNMSLKELSVSTLQIVGKIERVEAF